MSAVDSTNPAQKLADQLVNNSAEMNLSPADAFSNVKFVPHSNDNLLITCGWDGMCYIYDTSNNWLKYQTKTQKQPILGCVATDCCNMYYGGLDNTLYLNEFSESSCKPRTEKALGEHADAIRCVEFSEEKQIVVTGSWDSSVKLWDSKSKKCIGTLPQREQVFCLTVKDELMVVATGERKLVIWDLRSTGSPLFYRPSSLPKYQSRCIDLFEDKKKFVLGSVEGRIGIENIDPDQSGSTNYAFKAHVDAQNDHPVNAVRAIDNSCVASGGSDGRVRVWDIQNKKAINLLQYGIEIAALDYSSSNDTLAIGCSYLHDQEEEPSPLPPNKLYLRKAR